MKISAATVLVALSLALVGCAARSEKNTVAVVAGTPAVAPTATTWPQSETNQVTAPHDETSDGNAGPATFNGTAGVTEKKYDPDGVAQLVAVRTARHREFDRVVFEFRGGLPSYHIEYIDKPVRHCGSGNEMAMPGDAWLQIRFSPASAHTENGEPLVPTLKLRADHDVVKELASTCDFEAEVEWVAAVSKPNKYRVIELDNPKRLAVDVHH